MALYNGGYPATYQPIYPYQPQVQQQPQPQAQQSGSLIWIQGEQAAKSYLIAPNSTVVLFDSEAQTIYLKSADASGMPSIKVLDYTIRDSAKNPPNTGVAITEDRLSGFATKDEIKAVSEQITALRDRLDNLTKRRSREAAENE